MLCPTRRLLRLLFFFFFSSRRRHTRFDCDWSSDVCSSDLAQCALALNRPREMVAALTTLGPDRGLFRGWSVYWFYLTFGRHLMGDHRRELKEALEGRRRHPADFAVLEIGRAHV